MTFKISKDALDTLPYVTFVPKDGRAVPLWSFFDAEVKDWYLYMPHSDKELIRLAGGETTPGSYLGRVSADPASDIELPLGTLVVQHLSFPETLVALGNLENDVHRCAAILQKYHLLWEHRHDKHLSASLLVESELEYLLFLLRSLYDLLQIVVRDVCRRFSHPEDPARRAITDLPWSFADVIMKGHDVLDLGDLVSRYRMPEPLARWYHAEAPFFRELRALRDGIAHHGRQPPFVFETEWGFGIMASESQWGCFNEWPEEQLSQGRLGPLRSVFAGFIMHALQATAGLATTITTILKLPPALGHDLHLFIRSPFGHRLVQLEAMLNQPWEGKDIQAS